VRKQKEEKEQEQGEETVEDAGGLGDVHTELRSENTGRKKDE
jgi:hypothetical protein